MITVGKNISRLFSTETTEVIGPLVQRLRDELAPVVDLDSFWRYTAQRLNSFHYRNDVDSFQILAHLDLQAFATLIID